MPALRDCAERPFLAATPPMTERDAHDPSRPGIDALDAFERCTLAEVRVDARRGAAATGRGP